MARPDNRGVAQLFRCRADGIVRRALDPGLRSGEVAWLSLDDID